MHLFPLVFRLLFSLFACRPGEKNKGNTEPVTESPAPFLCHYIITNHGHGSGDKCTGRKGGTVLSIEAEHGHLPEQKAMVATLHELMEDLPDPEVFSTKQAAS